MRKFRAFLLYSKIAYSAIRHEYTFKAITYAFAENWQWVYSIFECN